MHASRSRNALVALLAALALLATPMAAHASGRQKPATSAAPKRTRSEAAKAGWQTRAMKEKADANWGARVAKNPALKGDKVAEAKFKAQSVRAQQQAATRKGTAPATAKKGKPVKLAKPKRVAAAEESAGAEGGEELDDGEVGDLGLGSGEIDDSQQIRRGSLVSLVKSYVKARRVFKQLLDEDPGFRAEFSRRSRIGGSFRNGILMGGGGLLAAVSIISGGTIGALLGIGAAGFGGARQFANNNRTRESMVQELEASGELEPDEIEAFEEAGWL